ncbi:MULTISPECIES: TetR/AcrR family transcriptional regulator [Bacillaceae]|uniref:TetR/AcrR family transcriptional regulator n=1 Tax=Niallia hominis TaxID=3133173 RepID=A0ABV1EW71_9BACI|nr:MULTISPECIES: TetR/AcrR family transcriptional regulator [Bacillaceae]MCF2647859.1 TetR/AcrR family transcriptional regulator [Niallia circulans]CAI9394149.1 HTH-type transcriptional regulator BetI [Bacillus sp. T2.9-1]
MTNGKLTNIRLERRDAAENRQRILEAALKLFEQYDVEQVSMNQIAKEADIGTGTLYRRYRNKGELCLDLIKDNIVIFFDNMENYLQDNQTATPAERLKGIIRLFIQFRESKAQLLKGVEDSEASPPSKPRTRSPLHDQLHQQFVNLFNEMNSTSKKTDTNVFKADILLAALKSDSYLFQREVRGYSPEDIAEALYEMFIL